MEDEIKEKDEKREEKGGLEIRAEKRFQIRTSREKGWLATGLDRTELV